MTGERNQDMETPHFQPPNSGPRCSTPRNARFVDLSETEKDEVIGRSLQRVGQTLDGFRTEQVTRVQRRTVRPRCRVAPGVRRAVPELCYAPLP